MATKNQGRRVAPRGTASHSSRGGRRVAAKPNRIPNQVSDKIGTFLSIAGLSATAFTAGSSITSTASHSVPSQVSEVTYSAVAPITSLTHPSLLNRVRAASRSEVRTSKDAKALNSASTAPTGQAGSTPRVLTINDRMQLRAFAGNNSQLATLVSDAQEQEAKAVAAQIAAEKAAREAATAKAAKAAQDSGAHYNADSNMTYPTKVSNPGGSYGAPAPSQADIDSRVMPVSGSYQLSARFGERGYRWSTGWHTGLDFVVPVGTPVRAAVDGVVIHSGWAGPYGYRIEVDAGNGFIITYNHLSKIAVPSGPITAGQYLGKSGATGNVTGPHLHFEVLYNGEFVNPAVWLWGASR